MILAFLARGDSIHTLRWVNEMEKRGHDTHLITMQSVGNQILPGVKIHHLPFGAPLGYYTNISFLKQKLTEIKPDVLHAHRASGFGALARLSRFHPYVLSVWGNDVYEFPNRSPVNRRIVIKNLSTADWVCSTSKVMAIRTRAIFPQIKNLSVIPFGIDTKVFSCDPRIKDNATITVGTVKTLAPKYGIDILIHAFARAKQYLDNRQPDLGSKLRLLIVGGGPKRIGLEAYFAKLGRVNPFVKYASNEVGSLKSMVAKLKLEEVTTFVGKVSHSEVPFYLNHLDVYVAPSRYESETFGVAILEASACGIPVVVAEVGGLPEVVEHGKTGFIVEKDNTQAFADTIIQLVENPQLGYQMGMNGREHVMRKYDWVTSASQMEAIYEQIADGTTQISA